MNVFTNLFFRDAGNPAEPLVFDEQDDRYATGFGNRIASARYFAPLGHARRTARDDAAPAPEYPALAVGCCA
ncbi:MAG TPA: hypothetical protein VGD42_00065 [Lysobacter sp.]